MEKPSNPVTEDKEMFSPMTFSEKVLRSATLEATLNFIRLFANFAGYIVLARILNPEEFGVFALANSAVMMVFMIAGWGLQQSIIQCREIHVKHLVSTSLYMIATSGLILAIISSSIGFFVKETYGTSAGQLILSLSWIYYLRNIAHAYECSLQRELTYRPIAIIGVIACLSSIGTAIVAAYLGCGSFALAIREAVLTIILLFGFKWASGVSMKLKFDRVAFRWIMKFSWKLSISRISEEIFRRSDQLAVGIFFGTEILGHYSLAYRLSLVVLEATEKPIRSVMFSTFAAVQESSSKLKFGFERLNYWLTRVTALEGLLILVVGKTMVIMMYGENWQTAGSIFQLMFMFALTIPMYEAFKDFLVASGKIKNVLKSQAVQILFFLPALAICIYYRSLYSLILIITFSILLGAVLFGYYCERIFSSNWMYFFRSPVLAFVISVITIYGLIRITPSFMNWHPFLQVTMITLLYLSILYCIDKKNMAFELLILRRAFI